MDNDTETRYAPVRAPNDDMGTPWTAGPCADEMGTFTREELQAWLRDNRPGVTFDIQEDGPWLVCRLHTWVFGEAPGYAVFGPSGRYGRMRPTLEEARSHARMLRSIRGHIPGMTIARRLDWGWEVVEVAERGPARIAERIQPSHDSRSPMWDAAIILDERAMQHEAFSRGVAAALRAMTEAARGGEATLRSLGGFTRIGREAFLAAVGDAAARGSKLLGPTPIASLLPYIDFTQLRNLAITAASEGAEG